MFALGLVGTHGTSMLMASVLSNPYSLESIGWCGCHRTGATMRSEEEPLAQLASPSTRIAALSLLLLVGAEGLEPPTPSL